MALSRCLRNTNTMQPQNQPFASDQSEVASLVTQIDSCGINTISKPVGVLERQTSTEHNVINGVDRSVSVAANRPQRCYFPDHSRHGHSGQIKAFRMHLLWGLLLLRSLRKFFAKSTTRSAIRVPEYSTRRIQALVGGEAHGD